MNTHSCPGGCGRQVSYRHLPDGRWAHLHTCLGGMAYDQRLWGQDYLTAQNPYVYGVSHG